MKTIIAGSRSITKLFVVSEAIKSSGWAEQITEVVSGNARGADMLGEMWAMRNSKPIKRFRADWDRYGKKKAGKKRNKEMAEYGDALILVWTGKSSGSKDMLQQMQELGKPTYSYIV
jgi:hypothetical protein